MEITSRNVFNARLACSPFHHRYFLCEDADLMEFIPYKHEGSFQKMVVSVGENFKVMVIKEGARIKEESDR